MTNQAEALRLFEQANIHWFGDMRFNQALQLYREALKHDPTDPVILYVLANVLWAFEEFDEAKEMFLQAQQHQDRLSDYGKQILAKEQQRLLETTSFQTPLPLPATELSFEKLVAMGLTHSQWLDIAYDAEERRMYNLAAEARERGFSSTDFDNEKDKMKLYHKSIDSFDDLQLMRKEAQE
jgi:tetratricopeptide (TPR) repeat protein